MTDYELSCSHITEQRKNRWRAASIAYFLICVFVCVTVFVITKIIFQVANTETAGKRKEDKHKDKLHSVQQQIQSKEQEIQSTQKQITQALVALVTDAEDCAKCTHGLSALFHKLGKFL